MPIFEYLCADMSLCLHIIIHMLKVDIHLLKGAAISRSRVTMSLLAVLVTMTVSAGNPVVVDSATGEPLAGASVFDNRGVMLGVSSSDGKVPFVSRDAYPLTIRYMGFHESTVTNPLDSIVRMKENFYRLPEVVVNASDRQVLHMLAYVREYSTLTTYTDTVTLYRDKWVDFMIPDKKKGRFKGWRLPRILSSSSYYHFSNSAGLDSVSDRFNQHFSWTDWVGVIDRVPVPLSIQNDAFSVDTVFGKYSPTETWLRKGRDITLDVNVLADTVSRRWMPNMSTFFKNHIDFECVKIRYNFNDGIVADYLSASGLTGIAVNIESNGRGRDMFRFNRRDEPFFVSTYAEIYLADKEYISVKEAKKWENYAFEPLDFKLLPLPEGVPPLQPSTEELIARVGEINSDALRLETEPDKRLAGCDLTPLTTKQKILKRLKGLLNMRGSYYGGVYNNSGNSR